MKFLTRSLVALSVFTALIAAVPLTRRGNCGSCLKDNEAAATPHNPQTQHQQQPIQLQPQTHQPQTHQPVEPAGPSVPGSSGRGGKQPQSGSPSGSKKSSTKSKPRTPSLNGPDYLYLVYYQPLADGTARHWSLFVTDSATIAGASGTIYEVVDHSQAVGNLRPQTLPNVVATKARRYEGSVFLSKINGEEMREHFETYAEMIIELIAEHNAKPSNARDLSNCQHWVEQMVVAFEIPRAKQLVAKALK